MRLFGVCLMERTGEFAVLLFSTYTVEMFIKSENYVFKNGIRLMNPSRLGVKYALPTFCFLR